MKNQLAKCVFCKLQRKTNKRANDERRKSNEWLARANEKNSTVMPTIFPESEFLDESENVKCFDCEKKTK